MLGRTLLGRWDKGQVDMYGPAPLSFSLSLFLGVLVHILTIHIRWSPLQNIQTTFPYPEFYLQDVGYLFFRSMGNLKNK